MRNIASSSPITMHAMAVAACFAAATSSVAQPAGPSVDPAAVAQAVPAPPVLAGRPPAREVRLTRIRDAKRTQQSNEVQGGPGVTHEYCVPGLGWKSICYTVGARTSPLSAKPFEPPGHLLMHFIDGSETVQADAFPDAVLFGTEEPPDFRCNATIIGPRTLLTAAHCIDFSGETNYVLQRGSSRNVELTCRKHASFVSIEKQPCTTASCPAQADAAFCTAGEDFAGATPELVSVPIPAAMRATTLTGYGFRNCSSSVGTLTSVGYLMKYDLEVAMVTWPAGDRQGIRRHFVVSKGLPGLPVCPGDSGLAWYSESAGQRKVVGVLSGTTSGEMRLVPIDSALVQEVIREQPPICDLGITVPGCP